MEPMVLGPLDRQEAADLASAVLDRAVTADEASELFRTTGGNPFFVEELVRHGATDATKIPQHLTELLTLPMQELSTDGRTLLRTVAAAGSAVDHHELAAVIGMSEKRLEAAARLQCGSGRRDAGVGKQPGQPCPHRGDRC